MSTARNVLQFLENGPATRAQIMAEFGLDGKQAGNVLNQLKLRSLVENDGTLGPEGAVWQLRSKSKMATKVPTITLSAWAVTPLLLNQIEASVREIDEFVGSTSTELLAQIQRVREYLGE